MSRPPASVRSPLRLLLLGAVLLWVVSPLLIGGLVTVGVRAHNAGHGGAGLAALLIVGGLVALLVLLGGFAALLTGVLVWWRGREGGRLVEATRDEDNAETPAAARELAEDSVPPTPPA